MKAGLGLFRYMLIREAADFSTRRLGGLLQAMSALPLPGDDAPRATGIDYFAAREHAGPAGPARARPSYAIGGSPANALRETLEVKYRHAASRGKTFIGDTDLLLRLRELGNEPVAVVSAHDAGKNFHVYVTPATLEPVGAVIMYDANMMR